MQRRKFLQNKLWRDKAAEMLQGTGSIIHTKKLNDFEFNEQLRMKLLEEAAEVQAAQTREELMNEIGDVLEVLDAMMRLYDLSPVDIGMLQSQKRKSRGGFNDRIFVTVAEHLPNSFGEKYCLKDPLKYPEIFD